MIRTTIAGISIICLCSTFGTGQDTQIIQFYTYDNLILIPSEVEGQEGFLILDSGAEGLALNIKYFDDDQNVDENLTAKGFNGPVENVLARRTNLRIDQHSWNDLRALVIDLGHLGLGEKLPILGLAGFQLLEEYEVLLDFKTSSLILFEVDEKGHVKDPNYQQTQFDISFPFKLKGHIPSIDIQIDQTILRMGLDTGSGIALIHPKFKPDLQHKMKPIKDIQLQGTDQKQKQAKLWRLSGMNVSMLGFPPINVAFTNINSFNSMLWGPKLDGILGTNFLRQFMTSINFKKKEMHIWIESNVAVFQGK